MTQFNLFGGEAQEPCVIVDGVRCVPKRINGKIRLVTPSGWVLPQHGENVMFRPLKNGGMQIAIPSEVLGEKE